METIERLEVAAPRTIAEVMFLLIRRTGRTVESVAGEAGLTRQALYEWSWNGAEARPSWDSVVRLARVLGSSLGCPTVDILADLERLDRITTDKGLNLHLVALRKHGQA